MVPLVSISTKRSKDGVDLVQWVVFSPSDNVLAAFEPGLQYSLDNLLFYFRKKYINFEYI